MKDELRIQTGLNTAKAHKMLSNAIKTLRCISNRYYYFLKSNPLIGFEIVVQRHHPRVRKCSCKNIALDIKNILECITHKSTHKDIELVLHIVKGDNLEDFYKPKSIASLKKPLDPVSQALIASTISEMHKQNNDVKAFCNGIGAKIGQEIDAIIDKYKTAITEEHAKCIESRTKLRSILFAANEELKKIHSSYRDNDELFYNEFFDVDNFEYEFISVHVKGRIMDDYFDLT